jgi:adenosylhomocysteine nucleosidase
MLADVLPGPVNAAVGAQALILRYGVGSLIGVGTAGALDPMLCPGDLVVAQQCVAHDAGYFTGRGFQHSGVLGRGSRGLAGFRRRFVADPDLLTRTCGAAGCLDGSLYAGTVVSGNQAIFSTTRKRWLHLTFDALAVDMETAALAQVAVSHRVPWIAIRAISDQADDSLIVDYRRLGLYLDGAAPMWWQRLRRLLYLLLHPTDRGRVRDLQRCLTYASERAALVAETMMRV